VCLPLLIFPCTIKSRSSLLARAHPGGPGKRAVKQLWCGADLDDLKVDKTVAINAHLHIFKFFSIIYMIFFLPMCSVPEFTNIEDAGLWCQNVFLH